MSVTFNGLWAYRDFITGSVKREFQSKYRNSLLGAAWTVLNPLAMIVVYTVIFSNLMGSRLPGNPSGFGYSIYLCSGILTWGLFAEITTRGQTVFLENASLIKKVRFPHMCLPAIVVLNALVNFAIVFGLFTAFLVASGNFPGAIYLALVPVLFVQIVFALGLGMVLGVLNVFFRDVGQLFTMVLLFWYWFTPIVYVPSALPASIQELMVLNPLAAVAEAYHAILVHAATPDWPSLLPAILLGIASFALGVRMIRKRAGDMIDEL